MLEDFAAIVLDISQNSVRAGAKNVTIVLNESKKEDLLTFTVSDDGCGMSKELLESVTDPFTTTRKTRRVGLGVPFLKQLAELCEGGLSITSEVGAGTTTSASFKLSCIDIPPMGDIPFTIITLIMGSPEMRWLFKCKTDDGEFSLDTNEVLQELDGDTELLTSPQVRNFLLAMMQDEMSEINFDSELTA